MKFRLIAMTATFAILLGAAAAVGASDRTIGQNAAGQAPPATVTGEKPSAMLPELQYEFDPVVDGTEITHDFSIKNTGSGTLAIDQVKTG